MHGGVAGGSAVHEAGPDTPCQSGLSIRSCPHTAYCSITGCGHSAYVKPCLR